MEEYEIALEKYRDEKVTVSVLLLSHRLTSCISPLFLSRPKSSFLPSSQLHNTFHCPLALPSPGCLQHETQCPVYLFSPVIHKNKHIHPLS